MEFREYSQHYPEISYFVDEATGVNYIMTIYHNVCGVALSVVPRLNADGSLYVTPAKKE